MTPFQPSIAHDLALRAKGGDPAAVKALCEQLSIPYHDRLPPPQLPPDLAGRLDVGWLRRNRLAPLSADAERVVVATPRVLALEAPDELAFYLGRRVEIAGATEDEILRTLNILFSESLVRAGDALHEIVSAGEDDPRAEMEAVPDLIDSADAAPVIKLVNRVLFQAMSERASDVHIEPAEGQAKIRFRIDGVLYDRLSPPKSYLPFLCSRLKVMSDLDIAERRLPQDGRFQFNVAEKSVDVRVSIIPTAGGERVVLRLLDKATALLGLEDLGLTGADLEAFLRLIAQPHGIILVTGPTGSGKTTTLYAALSRLNTRELNVITIEDPVEYDLPGVGQIHVNPKVGLDFARGLRSVLRHDPDVIMIGEIRDLETAEIAIQSSLTGHLVFSTLHTNDAPSAVTRLVDMGVEPYLVSSAVIGLAAQRLVRLLCPFCREPEEPSPRALARAGLPADALAGETVYRPRGCGQCLQTGYRGRTGIYELLIATEPIRRVMASTGEAGEIRRAALAAGMKPLVLAGLEKVRQGKTALEEVLRVTSA
ncbi:MAG: type II secretion system ATPase GspE [Thermodesulfobacteriota bacterium]